MRARDLGSALVADYGRLSGILGIDPGQCLGEKVAPAAAASSKCLTSPRSNGSAAASGRYQTEARARASRR